MHYSAKPKYGYLFKYSLAYLLKFFNSVRAFIILVQALGFCEWAGKGGEKNVLVCHRRRPYAGSCCRRSPERQGRRHGPTGDCRRFRWHSRPPMRAGIPLGRPDLRSRCDVQVSASAGLGVGRSYLLHRQTEDMEKTIVSHNKLEVTY